MLFTSASEQVDEAAHGFDVRPVPMFLCGPLLRSAARPPYPDHLSVSARGLKATAVRTADGLLRITMDGAAADAPRAAGPGTELKKLLAALFIRANAQCSCHHMANEMNRLGPAWCLANMDRIVDVMAHQAARRKLPFVRAAARALVRLAVRRAR